MHQKKSTTTNVAFKLLEVKSKILYQSGMTACYSHVTYGALPRSVKFLRTHIATKYSQYDEAEVIEWCEMMNRIGFPVAYRGIDKDEGYVFVFTISKYKQKLHLTSALTIVRYLWEDGLDNVPKEFFKIMKEVEGISEWEALQMAHGYMGSYCNTNHSLRDWRAQTFIPQETLTAKYKGHPIYNSAHPNITHSWAGMKVDNAPASYVDRYKFLKAKS